MSVSVVIVNFRTPALTVLAIESSLAQPECTEVLVVDNASGDNSLTVLRDRFTDSRVKILESAENLGFGRANNLAANRAVGGFLFLLNSDARLHENALGTLLKEWPRFERPGILAPAVYLADGETLQVDALGPFPTVERLVTRKTKVHGTSLTPDWVSGCAMLIRRDTFLAVGGFDPEIFMYFEDVLLCRAFRKMGLGIHRCLDAGVTHEGGGSMESRLNRKAIYYSAQDVMLRKMGEPGWGIFLVRLLRWPNLVLGRLLGRT